MNIGEEKEHIYSLMREVTEERRKLTNIYFNLKERLDDLHKLEQRGLTDLSLKGYVDLHKKVIKDENETAIKNIERESKVAIKKIEKETEELEEKKEEPKFKKQIQEEMNIKKVIPKKLSTEALASVISSVLEDHGAPMSLVDLHKEVNNRLEYKIKINNFRNNIIHRAMRITDRIERASHGYYQYRL